MSVNAEKSAQLASTMITVVILSSLAGMGGTWAYENRESLYENGEEWLYRIPRPHLWTQPADKRTCKNDPTFQPYTHQPYTLPVVDYSKNFPRFDGRTVVIPRVQVNIPRNFPMPVPYRSGGFR